MYCIKCGKMVSDTAKHCPYCGAAILGKEEAQRASASFNGAANGRPQNVPNMTQQNPFPAAAPQNMENGKKAKAPKKAKALKMPKERKSHKGLLIGTAAALVVICAGGALTYKLIDNKLEENYSTAIASAEKAAAAADYETAAAEYQDALSVFGYGDDKKAADGLSNAKAMSVLKDAAGTLTKLTSYDASIDYNMQLHIKDSTDDKEYDLTQTSSMTVSNIQGENGTTAYVTGTLSTSSDAADGEDAQDFQIYVTKNGNVRTDYSYTEAGGWGAKLKTGDDGENSILLGDIASLDYTWDSKAESDDYVFTAAGVKTSADDFLTSFCSITEKASSTQKQKRNVSLYINKESGMIDKIVVSYPDLSMTDVNSYYCDYSGKGLSMSLNSISYTIAITDWSSDAAVSVPEDALNAVSIGSGLASTISFSTEPISYLGPNTEEGSFGDVMDFSVPTTWTAAASGGEATSGGYYLNAKGTAILSFEYLDSEYFTGSNDEANLDKIEEAMKDSSEMTLTDYTEVTIGGQTARQYGFTGTVTDDESSASQTYNGVMYLIPTSNGYMSIEYYMADGVENIWQSEFNNFLASVTIK